MPAAADSGRSPKGVASRPPPETVQVTATNRASQLKSRPRTVQVTATNLASHGPCESSSTTSASRTSTASYVDRCQPPGPGRSRSTAGAGPGSRRFQARGRKRADRAQVSNPYDRHSSTTNDDSDVQTASAGDPAWKVGVPARGHSPSSDEFPTRKSQRRRNPGRPAA